ncbi:MAG: dihydropteroate synthase [Candidatus Omnitrophica bacterium]|nr:dihydropteroate synthase [Candidatus Omnitrophota bacterium]MCM8777317.1 dihydropteroate synthase [Candidatus Omnitrophota bacterium]
MKDIWKIKDKRLEIKRFLIMGILNTSPDSFYSGSSYPDLKQALNRAVEMVKEGADIIDVGGQSTRPGSKSISVEEEIERVIPVIKELSKGLDIPISCDTYKAVVAEKAIEAGASIINDISAFSMDVGLLDVIKSFDCGYVLMHMKGTPEDMQVNPFYEDVVSEVFNFLYDKLSFIEKQGIEIERVVVDPGIGFGKRFEDNLALLKNIEKFSEIGRPVLLGTSRKSFIGKILNNISPEHRLEGSIASAVIGYIKGVKIFRVHDVKETRRTLEIASAILSS